MPALSGPDVPDDVRALVERLHTSGTRAVVICAGAGSRAFAWLHAVPGSSRTVVELVSAYSHASLADWLGAPPATSAGPGTAGALARAACARGRELGDPGIGVALVAAIASASERRAAPRICVASCRDDRVVIDAIALEGRAPDDRARHEEVASRMLVNALAAAAGLAPVQCPLAPGESVTRVHEPIDALVLAVSGGHLAWFVAPPTGAPVALGPTPRALLAGSFDPLHHGHRGLAQVAAFELGCEVGFELSLANADKGRLDLAPSLARVAQFSGIGTVVVDRASTFVEKARLFPGTTFVVGYDTAVRVLDEAYYGGSLARDRALAELAGLGGQFLVAGRACDGVYRPAESLVVPPAQAAMFRVLGEARFRADVSSTELRQLGRAADRTGRVEEGRA